MSECSNCGSTELTTDASRGIVCCEDCGMIQEENMIVNTVQFDTNNSKSVMQGKVVNVENKNVGTKYVDSCYYIKNTIKNICSKLSLSNNNVEVAFRWYKLCLANNLTKGKSILYTLSACIYISCRQEGSPHMLIDFSNILRIDMYQIGKVYLKIKNTFNINNSSLELYTLYLHRFVEQLQFKNKKSIIMLSTRILNRMKKDWIMEGRKPNNACGAAIVLASRMQGEPRDIIDVAKVVHAAPTTITKRLKEISETDTAALNVEEFNTEWIEEETVPPVMKSNSNSKNIKNSKNSKNNFLDEFNMILMQKTSKPNVQMPQEESEYSNISEYDVTDMILSKEEIESKKVLWEEMYGEYVKEVERKKDKNTKKTTKIVRKKKHNFETVEEAYKSLDKKVSSKLNYNAINDLFQK